MEKARIQIVEDEAIIAMELESRLQGLGYEVTSVVNTGERAIAKAEEDQPNLIMMDIRIKGEMDGIGAAEVIRNRFGIPVIFSTAYLDQERIERAKITMPFGYVLKPIQERDLKATLEMALYVAKVDRRRLKAEKELRLEKEKFKAAFFTSPDAVLITQMDGTYVEVNEGFTRMTVYTRDDVIGKRSADIKIWSFPEDREKLYEGLKRDRYVENLESKFRRKDGSIITALISASIIEIEGELHILSVVKDITERKNIEDELQKSQLTFSQLFYQSSTSMCLYNAHGTFVRANLEFCRMFGVEEEAIVGIKYNIFEDQTSTDGLILYTEKLFNEKKSVRWQLVYDLDVISDFLGITTVKGGKIEIEVFGYPILDDQNNLQYVVLQHYDIGERDQMEADLRTSEEKYRRLFEDSIDGYALADPDTGIISDCNQALADLVGRSREELTGQHQRILHPLIEQNEEYSPTFNQHRNDKSGEVLETHVVTKTGEIRNVSIRARVFEVSNKKIMHAIFRLIEL